MFYPSFIFLEQTGKMKQIKNVAPTVEIEETFYIENQQSHATTSTSKSKICLLGIYLIKLRCVKV